MKKIYALTLLLYLTCLPLRAEDIYVLEPVQVNADERTAADLEPTAFSQTIDLTAYSDSFFTTEEILRGSVGANVRSIGGLGGYSTIALRGSGANQTLILLDGQRLNASTGGGVDLSRIPVSDVERIEIIRGSDSALFGSNALGGIVNIITKDPRREPSANMSATIGNNFTREYQAAASGTIADAAGIAVNLSRRHSDNDYDYQNNNGTEFDPRDDYETRRINNEFDDYFGSVKIRGGGENWEVNAGASAYQSDKEIPGIVTFPTLLADQHTMRNTYSLKGKYTLNEKLTCTTGMGRIYQSDRYKDPEALTGAYSFNETTTDQFSFFSDWRQGELTVTPGFSYLREAMDDIAMPDRTRHTRSGLLRFDYRHDPVQILLTGRFDDNSKYDTRWTYRAGTTFFFTDHIWFKANTGLGYRMPSFYELYYSQGFITANPNLKPEESVSWDIGPVFDFSRTGATLNLFLHRYSNEIVYILQSGFYYKPYNISRSRTRGLEFSAWVEPLDGLRISGNYTYCKAVDTTGEYNHDGRQIPGRPRNLANIQVDYAFKVKKIAVSLYVSHNYTEGNFITRANTKKLDDRRISNCGLKIEPYEKLCISLDLKNITDEMVTDLRGFPLEGRSWYVTANFKL